MTDRSPSYVQVTEALRILALAHPWDDDGPLPAESELAAHYGVSRGTLRRATQQLVQERLLSSEPGRGTFVRRRQQLRMTILSTLAEIALPDSRYHLDVLQFVPDFVGSEACGALLRDRPEYRSAKLLLIAPDNSLRGSIQNALADGIRTLVPTYGLRRGFVLLEPDEVPPTQRAFASTLDGLERFGRTLTLAELRTLGRVDAIVTGAMALTTRGVHVGSGTAYLDLEWGLLSELGLVDDATSVIGIVHDRQVVDLAITPGPFDIGVTAIITPHGVTEIPRDAPRPSGVRWSAIDDQRLEEIPYLAQLRPDPFRKGPTP